MVWPEAARQSKSKKVVSWFRHRLSLFLRGVRRPIYASGVAVVYALVPRRWWYVALFRVSGWLAWLVRCVRPGHDKTLQARILDPLMMLMTLKGGEFPILIRTEGDELLDELSQDPTHSRGVVFCSGHLPLVRVGASEIMERGQFRIVAMIREPEREHATVVPGKSELVRAIFPDSYVLLRGSRLLKSGESLLVLPDWSMGGPAISPNIMHLVRRVGTQLVIVVSELERDGTVFVRFVRPPDPRCKTDAGIEANVRFLSRQIRQVLG